MNARACTVAYEAVRDALYRKHVWRFATARATLAAEATPPDWGRGYAYQLPSDFIRLADPYEEDLTNDLDWEIEGQKIYSDDSDPIYIRYVKRVTDPNVMDPLFRELLACELALEICEAITQSNTKKAGLEADRDSQLAEARRANAIEGQSKVPPEDTWVTVRV